MTAQNPVSTANLILLSFGGLCLLTALAIAWVLGVTLFFPDGALAAHLAERDDIIRAHVDYLMMAQFLLIFFLAFRQYAIDPPLWLVASCCFGAFFNPLAFLLRGLTPKAVATIPVEPHFPLQAALSFSLTTFGFLGAIVLIARAAWMAHLARS
ncbi:MULTISPECIES: hypothetical protein [Methylomonas]|uniref:DUF4149 domain-containing protein n=2 Tax=Methylomonas TaxID=416 RepID=A0A140E5T9_9GAMM|nr:MULTISPECIES: hypothetical protein [Methylomonas]AMK78763.1 hypothetical protein JT25_020100 [Methylomonas denitrificans]OAI08412.1 hypothetical protein A1342_11055 [Methylomonas methanica]TCV83481.1 hypothetical protein EDE11_10938 [Methylomonas methanica]